MRERRDPDPILLAVAHGELALAPGDRAMGNMPADLAPGRAISSRIPAVPLIGSRAMKTFVLLIGLLCCGCPATVGTGSAIYVPKDAAATCASHCQEIGLALNSVVIMASNVGCVCSAAPGAPGGGVSGGGMAALLMAEQQRRSAAPTYQPPPHL